MGAEAVHDVKVEATDAACCGLQSVAGTGRLSRDDKPSPGRRCCGIWVRRDAATAFAMTGSLLHVHCSTESLVVR